jgi:Domain of unknown function (DUF4145)
VSPYIELGASKMSLDRDLWLSSLTRFHAPRWLCPRCRQGHFVLQPESVFFRPSGEAYAQLEQDPEDRGNDLELRFSAMLQCDNRTCQETATIAGVGEEKSTYETGHHELYVVLYPKFISPSPNLFQIPAATPACIVTMAKSAFVLSWGDYEACLNRVRSCLELLLNNLRIPRSALKAGKRKLHTLHRRIELAQAKAPMTSPFLMAAKHLGNAGSHGSAVTRNDVFDALDLLGAIIEALYGEEKKIKNLAVKIVKNRGPLKHKAN